jgi:phosphonate transport system substrate-binding protein
MTRTTLIAAAVAAVALTPAIAQEAGGSDVYKLDVERDLGIEEFRIGLLGGENASDRLRSNECLRQYTEDLLGVPTKLFAPADYNGVIEGLLGGNLDMAWLGASGYAKVYLNDPDAVEPVLVKINTDGSFGYYSVGFARADSGIESLEDMADKEFGFGDPNSTSGYLIPSIEIPQAGEEITMEPGDYFADVTFTGGHEQTIVAVYNGDIDAGVTWADGLGAWEDGYNSGALRKAADAGLVDMTELVQIWQSKVIPEGPIVVRKDLPERVKFDVIGLMASLESMDPECAYGVMAGEVKGLAPVNHEVYTSIIEARRAKIGE